LSVSGVKPQWVILGGTWDAPGVFVIASDSLTEAELEMNYRAKYKYMYESFEEMRRSLTNDIQRTLKLHFTKYVMIAGPDYLSCLKSLLDSGWNPSTPPALPRGR
jgi:hypothetical protein